MKTAHVKFGDPQFNYSTSINGTDEEIKAYFVGQEFNLGAADQDNLQRCIAVEITEAARAAIAKATGQ